MEDLQRLITRAANGVINWAGIEAALSPFVHPMVRTRQNPAYHGEGDVWTHTKLVCEELVKMDAYQALSIVRRQLIFLAALLHDIGKSPPLVGRMEPGFLPTTLSLGQSWLVVSCGKLTAGHRRSFVFGKRCAVLFAFTASQPMPWQTRRAGGS